jgi:hypothetical protein
MSNLHKVLRSSSAINNANRNHYELDESYKKLFELRFGNKFGAIIPGSVKVGDIDPYLPTETIRQKICDEYLRDTSVTVVLVGALTWQRKHVDWDIASSIRDTAANPRSGLLGILLPAYYDHHFGGMWGKYNPRTIPPRLHDNVGARFATIHSWSEDPAEVQDWIHKAYLRKSRVLPNNARESFAKNRSGRANSWS